MSSLFRQLFSWQKRPPPQAGPLRQRGIAIMIIVFLIALGATAYLVVSLNANSARLERDTQTTAALIEAKAALIAYAMAVDTTAACGGTNCPRPGDLPCPDMNNDGVAEASCGNAAGTTQQANRLGRLPWKTLHIPELKDGNGEDLWYAVSSNFKENSRFRPLNSDTNGTITVRDIGGNIVYDGTGASGAVAIIISAGAPLTRQDGTIQVRSAANINNPVHFLDNAFGEDNAAFVDSGADGFVSGPVRDANGDEILNDRLVTISQNEIFAGIERRVAADIANALMDYYCGLGNADYATSSCVIAGGNRFFPTPAAFADNSCLGNGNLGAGCNSGVALTGGRIPANPATAWSGTSILRGVNTGNWFQLNAWREVVYYGVSALCSDGTANCPAGNLTLDGNVAQKVVIIASGRVTGLQQRTINADKSAEANYLEDGNLAPLDDVYVSRAAGLNDRVISIP